ncbi:MAG: PH domain-containing protein [Patescibacteria group bacterium]
MPYKYFADQMDDEEVLFVFRKHPVVMRKGLVLAMTAPLLGVIPAAIKPELGFGWFFGGLGIGIAVGMLLMFPAWISWYYTMFIVTDQRFIQMSQKGMFNRSLVDIALSQVQMVNYEVAGMQETLLGFGTIMMQTYMGDLVIHDVSHPAKTQKKLLSILRDRGIISTAYPGQSGSQNNNEAED